MEIRILNQSDFTVGSWSGGTTTQLYIWPERGDYGRREFIVRISSATVEDEESDFTPLPGVTRYITPLKGGFILTHPGRAPVVMSPLDAPYRFDGGIETHCAGKATDFNLMLRGVGGEMVIDDEVIAASLTAVYPLQEGDILVGDVVCHVRKGELAVISGAVGEVVKCPRAIVCKADI